MSETTDPVRICSSPFSTIEVGRQSFIPCCGDWLSDEYLGMEKGSDLWNGPQALELRARILRGDYSHCDLERCRTRLRTLDELDQDLFSSQDDEISARNLLAMRAGEAMLPNGPTTVIVYADTRCNLACPSCRTDAIHVLDEAQARKVAEAEELLTRERERIRVIKLASDGEVFFSPWLRATLKSCSRERFPRLKEVHILSNGLLFDERALTDLRPGTDAISRVHISVDAGDEETYRSVRGGDWKRLMRNLDWMAGLRAAGRFKQFQLNFVIRKANYRSIPAFLELGARLGVDSFHFTRLHKRDGSGITDFEAETVHLPGHPEHGEYLRIIREHPLASEVSGDSMKRRRPELDGKEILRFALLIALGVFLFLGALEIGMRTVGRGMLAEQEEFNEIKPDDANVLRIAAIGESTVSDFMVGNHQAAWPRQLERKLAEHGIRARVYNLGRPATNTSLILERLPEQLDHFHPQIVLSMLGRNDTEITVNPSKPQWYDSLRVVRLARWLNRAFELRRVGPMLGPGEFGDPGENQKIIERLKSKSPFDAMAPIFRQTWGLHASERAQFYLYLAEAMEPLPDGSALHREAKLELLRRSLASVFTPWGVERIVRIFSDSHAEDECLSLAHELVRRGWVFFSDRVLQDFSICALNSRTLNGATTSGRYLEWRELLGKLGGGAAEVEYGDRNLKKARNYRAIHQLIESRGIVHIAVDHPVQELEGLKAYFKTDPSQREVSREFSDIYFVENRKNFLDALAKRPYYDLFIDHLAGTYGHLTEFGHSLIADAVLPAVLSAVEKRKLTLSTNESRLGQ